MLFCSGAEAELKKIQRLGCDECGTYQDMLTLWSSIGRIDKIYEIRDYQILPDRVVDKAILEALLIQ